MADKTPLPQPSPIAGIERPLYVISNITGQSPVDGSALYLQIHRMDGLPQFDRNGERLRSDRENWLSLPEVMSKLSEMVGKMPQYATLPRISDEMAENLRRFNEEFGYEVVPENQKAG